MKKKLILNTTRSAINVDLTEFQSALNPEQFNAVIHDKGAALVIAGAGSGKTRTLTYRVAYLIKKGIPPNAIILVTFTKKAAQEMLNRVEKLIGFSIRSFYAGTFHHIANKILRIYAPQLGFRSNFTILDEEDQHELMKLVISQSIKNQPEERYPTPSQLCHLYSRRINLALPLTDALNKFYPQYSHLQDQIEKLFNLFIDRKKQQNVMDFDDLIVYALNFLQNKRISTSFLRKIQYILVDEYQDVNAIQAHFVKSLSEFAHSVMVVGDDAQAIYSFRGADFTHMLNFPTVFSDVTQFRLETNYRSTPEILQLANVSISHNVHQFQKTLNSTRPSGEHPNFCSPIDIQQESEVVCQMILEYRDQGIPLHEQTVLFRAGFHRATLELELLSQNIPYEVRAGIRFFEQAHIKDVIAYLCIFANPSDDVQWVRILTNHEGITALSAQKILNKFDPEIDRFDQFIQWDLQEKFRGQRIQKNGISQIQHLQQFFQQLLYTSSSSNGSITPISSTPQLSIRKLSETELPRLADLIEIIVKYLTLSLKNKFRDSYEERRKDLIELSGFATTYSSITEFLSDVLTQISIVGEHQEGLAETSDEKPVILSTIHQAKGLEWKVVYVINLVEGRFPSIQALESPEDIEEERRLFYVACTRAQDHLWLLSPRFIPIYNNQVIPRRSRFIEEIALENAFDEIEIEKSK